MNLVLLPETKADLNDGIDWFEGLRAGLGDEFESDFFASLERIKSGPEMFAENEHGYRACKLKRFTGVVYFRMTRTEIVIVGLLVNGRSEGRLKDRE